MVSMSSPDDPNTRFFNIQATGTVRARADAFLSDLSELHQTAATASQQVADVVLLLNFALM
jgi:hypothetical protein